MSEMPPRLIHLASSIPNNVPTSVDFLKNLLQKWICSNHWARHASSLLKYRSPAPVVALRPRTQHPLQLKLQFRNCASTVHQLCINNFKSNNNPTWNQKFRRAIIRQNIRINEYLQLKTRYLNQLPLAWTSKCLHQFLKF